MAGEMEPSSDSYPDYMFLPATNTASPTTTTTTAPGRVSLVYIITLFTVHGVGKMVHLQDYKRQHELNIR